MQELQAIIAAFQELRTTNQSAALTTVVKTSGSTYWRSGARMLITSDRNSIGTISGDCLENDVCEQAKQVITSCKPIVVTYDTTSDAAYG